MCVTMNTAPKNRLGITTLLQTRPDAISHSPRVDQSQIARFDGISIAWYGSLLAVCSKCHSKLGFVSELLRNIVVTLELTVPSWGSPTPRTLVEKLVAKLRPCCCKGSARWRLFWIVAGSSKQTNSYFCEMKINHSSRAVYILFLMAAGDDFVRHFSIWFVAVSDLLDCVDLSVS